MSNVTFKPMGPDFRQAGNCTVTKQWEIKRDGEVVGAIESTIRDLNQDYASPGYSVTVIASINGVEKSFRRNSGTFSNRSMREAMSNRSYYVSQAKDWAKKGGSSQPLPHGQAECAEAQIDIFCDSKEPSA
ncbi:hypothetical protein E8F20_05985 [Pseudomonas sp. BN415]|uniref:hypothetical protein n=1 Tax=Pseudomonas sp. BN415 TaxID=2567889 RepID=UPI002457FDAD|nr:hypothetical protein [Pseudomonas sp. BN415]MDH4581425.1 hypothetical protein [Pseudomonas sp. BN415]